MLFWSSESASKLVKSDRGEMSLIRLPQIVSHLRLLAVSSPVKSLMPFL